MRNVIHLTVNTVLVALIMLCMATEQDWPFAMPLLALSSAGTALSMLRISATAPLVCVLLVSSALGFWIAGGLTLLSTLFMVDRTRAQMTSTGHTGYLLMAAGLFALLSGAITWHGMRALKRQSSQ